MYILMQYLGDIVKQAKVLGECLTTNNDDCDIYDLEWSMKLTPNLVI